MAFVAVGVPTWPHPATSWDWWPWVGILLICFVGMRSFRMHLGLPLFAAAICLGPVVATMVHRWGVIGGIGWILVVAIASALVRKAIGPQPPSDAV
jgi:hypothetical protein